MINFGIFRKLEDQYGELLAEVDVDQVYGMLLERLHHHLPKLEKEGKIFKKVPRGWTQAEISNAFRMAWGDMDRFLKSQTLRIS